MKSLIIGGSAGLGRALAAELARRGHALIITGRDQRDVEAVVKDLQLRFNAQVFPLLLDLEKIDPVAVRTEVHNLIGPIDNLFLISGYSDLKRDFQMLKPHEARGLIDINFTGPTELALQFLPDLRQSQGGNLVGAGTVAEMRARDQNTVYAASKRALEFLFEGLRQHLSDSPCRTQFYRLGFLQTSLSYGLSTAIPIARPEAIAKRIADNLGRDIRRSYLPGFWFLIAAIYCSIPWPIFKRMRTPNRIAPLAPTATQAGVGEAIDPLQASR